MLVGVTEGLGVLQEAFKISRRNTITDQILVVWGYSQDGYLDVRTDSLLIEGTLQINLRNTLDTKVSKSGLWCWRSRCCFWEHSGKQTYDLAACSCHWYFALGLHYVSVFIIVIYFCELASRGVTHKFYS